jgi:DNA-binding response OmpR family regulator
MMTLKKILIVEDDLDLHESLKTFLQSEGFEVRSAYDGMEAREMILKWRAEKETGPDSIVLDLMMPKMNGQDLLALLHSTSALGTTQVVVLSAASNPQANLPHIPLKFLAKPFDLGELLGALA